MSLVKDYSKMATSEKFLMLEELWENMSHDATQNGFTPKWHLDVLASREESIENAKAKFSNYEDAKKRLQKLI